MSNLLLFVWQPFSPKADVHVGIFQGFSVLIVVIGMLHIPKNPPVQKDLKSFGIYLTFSKFIMVFSFYFRLLFFFPITVNIHYYFICLSNVCSTAVIYITYKMSTPPNISSPHLAPQLVITV